MEELKGVSRFRYELNQLMETENEKDGGNLDILKLIAQQWALFIPYMEEMAKNDVQLNAKMMNPDLSFIDLVKFLCEKAYKLVVPGTRMAGMDSELVLNWIRDYYDHEGVALVKERREKQQRQNWKRKSWRARKKVQR